jgi:hypothetical protein
MKQKRGDYIVLMADIIQSSGYPQAKLMSDFKELVHFINIKYQRELASPLTITLGDEFQGVVNDTQTAIHIIIDLEEKNLLDRKGIKIRYVCCEGAIDTPINPTIAYEMLGEGLTNARKRLSWLKKEKHRFYFELKNTSLSTLYYNTFVIFDSILESWQAKDVALVASFLVNEDYKKVAQVLGKNRSLIWKREKSLRLNEYYAIKHIINNIK